MYGWASLNFEGFLREVQVYRVQETSDGREERIAEKKYALLLATPTMPCYPQAYCNRSISFY